VPATCMSAVKSSVWAWLWMIGRGSRRYFNKAIVTSMRFFVLCQSPWSLCRGQSCAGASCWLCRVWQYNSVSISRPPVRCPSDNRILGPNTFAFTGAKDQLQLEQGKQ
jgi:hypothetical protein